MLKKKLQIILISISLAFAFQNCLSYFALANSEQRSYSQELESKSLNSSRSFLKAKQWFTYRLEGTGSKILKEDLSLGILEGKGFLGCRVPYGVGEVDVEYHEFSYQFQMRDNHASIRFENIYSYSRDPNDITISYGPRNDREARITIRKCFEPLAEDLFDYIQ
jgi:hypothetical protein